MRSCDSSESLCGQPRLRSSQAGPCRGAPPLPVAAACSNASARTHPQGASKCSASAAAAGPRAACASLPRASPRSSAGPRGRPQSLGRARPDDALRVRTCSRTAPALGEQERLCRGEPAWEDPCRACAFRSSRRSRMTARVAFLRFVRGLRTSGSFCLSRVSAPAAAARLRALWCLWRLSRRASAACFSATRAGTRRSRSWSCARLWAPVWSAAGLGLSLCLVLCLDT